mgnify:CR=1 FL=1
MNSALWVAQVVLMAAFVLAGVSHLQYERTKERMDERTRQRLRWAEAVPPPLLTFIGICEILGALGLILPAVTGVLPVLTPLAATGLGVIMLLAILFHAVRREFPLIAVNLVLLVLAAFVAYGRFVLAPL